MTIESFRQGDLLTPHSDVDLIAPLASDQPHEILGLVISTQCCDIARENKGEVSVSPLLRLRDEDLRRAQDSKGSRFAPFPHVSADAYVDLGQSRPISRDALTSLAAEARLPIPSTLERVRFQRSIERRMGRFAYPDELNKPLSRLTDFVREKISKPNSRLRPSLDRIDTMRLKSDRAWGEWPCNLTLQLVIKDGFWWSLEPDQAPLAEPIETRDLNALATLIEDTDPTDPQAGDLWQRLAETLADRIPTEDASGGRITSVSGEAYGISEFTLLQYRESHDLDLDDLSEVSPVAGGGG